MGIVEREEEADVGEKTGRGEELEDRENGKRRGVGIGRGRVCITV
jgi:hypothetical protein